MGLLRFAKRHKILTGSALLLGTTYSALMAPAVPYTVRDLANRQGTEQQFNMAKKKESLFELSKPFFGLAAYPALRIQEHYREGKADLEFIINKREQQLYAYDEGGKLLLQTPVSTGADKEKDRKVKFKDAVTPPGKYIAIVTADKGELHWWYNEKHWWKFTSRRPFGWNKASYYGDGAMLFMGRWFPNIAIHGTPDESKLGEETSAGCGRVDAQSIKWIIAHAGAGSRLTVQPYSYVPHVAQPGFHPGQALTSAMGIDSIERFHYNNPHLKSIDDIRPGTIYFTDGKAR